MLQWLQIMVKEWFLQQKPILYQIGIHNNYKKKWDFYKQEKSYASLNEAYNQSRAKP